MVTHDCRVLYLTTKFEMIFINHSTYCSQRQYVLWTVHISLQWRHNGRNGVPNHQHHDCLLNRLFKAQIKENIKAPHHWSLCGEIIGDRWIPHTKGKLRGKCFHLMTPSCSCSVTFNLDTVPFKMNLLSPLSTDHITNKILCIFMGYTVLAGHKSGFVSVLC